LKGLAAAVTLSWLLQPFWSLFAQWNTVIWHPAFKDGSAWMQVHALVIAISLVQ
jgi:hypothetical protein